MGGHEEALAAKRPAGLQDIVPEAAYLLAGNDVVEVKVGKNVLEEVGGDADSWGSLCLCLRG